MPWVVNWFLIKFFDLFALIDPHRLVRWGFLLFRLGRASLNVKQFEIDLLIDEYSIKVERSKIINGCFLISIAPI